MRSMFRLLSVASLVITCSAAPAYAVTAQDLVKLHVAGLSDDILIALIAADESTFKLTATDIISLRGQGLSERVIHAMITAGRPLPPQVVMRDPLPGAVVLYAQAPNPAPAQPAPSPVVNVTQHVEQTVESPRAEPQTVYVPVYVSVPVQPREPEKKAEPVYWGYGGQRRPDAWKDRK